MKLLSSLYAQPHQISIIVAEIVKMCSDAKVVANARQGKFFTVNRLMVKLVVASPPLIQILQFVEHLAKLDVVKLLMKLEVIKRAIDCVCLANLESFRHKFQRWQWI